ncbi:hypothetical protein [Nocardia neocaledoniensis]|uniref:hypothetical protein n=1 Tax=Nocardia neocaledoniensis TaxID=236511 RepID=UPI0024589268|nr:hypothetical protein [Nocardia neocaledoniensis]
MINVEYLDNSHAARFVGYMENENNGRPPQGHGGSDDTLAETADGVLRQPPPVTAADVARLLQEVEAASRRQRARAFGAGLASSSLGRLVGQACEKLLDKLDWFGLV